MLDNKQIFRQKYEEYINDMLPSEAIMRAEIYDMMLKDGASKTFAGVAAIGCAIEKLKEFHKELTEKLKVKNV